MKTIFEHIEHVKGKPHHIRKRVAFTAATFGAGLIAIVWLAGSISTNAFAIKGSSFADSTGQEITTTGSDTAATSQLAGVGAASAFDQPADVPAHIEIVNTTPASSEQKQAEQTTIPF